MANIDQIINTAKSGIADLADTVFGEVLTEARIDAGDLLESMKSAHGKWIEQLAAGKISVDDFKDLILGEGDLGELESLKAKGIAQITIDKFRNGLIDLVCKAAVSAI